MDKIHQNPILPVIGIMGIFLSVQALGANTAPSKSQVPIKKVAMPGKTVTAKAPATTAKEPPAVVPFYLLYSYYGDRYRDPFIPLTAEFRNDQGADRPPQISTLLLKGIIQDEK